TPLGTASVGCRWHLGHSTATVDAPGERSIVVEALDAAGAVAAAASPVMLNVAAAAPVIAAPTLNANGAEGPGEFVFSGRGTPGSEVEVLVNGESVGTATVGAMATGSCHRRWRQASMISLSVRSMETKPLLEPRRPGRGACPRPLSGSSRRRWSFLRAQALAK
ncbi:hypothetical protein HC891_18035, partial [Candidatus Gracilibacteria bacterium]|nr:hypothetical protein [Candidatus Gracilibacteria bacterium]